MESNEAPTRRPSPDEARSSLDDARVEADLADRMVTPWWMYPGLGLAEALIISSITFPVSLGAPAVAVDEPIVTAVTAMVVLVATVVLGRRADSALRDRLRHGTRIR